MPVSCPNKATPACVCLLSLLQVAAISSARSSARAAAREHTPKCPLITSRHQGARPFLVVVQHVAVSGSATAPQAGTSNKRPRELAIQEGRTAWKMARTSAISKDPACNAQRTWVCGGGCGYKSYAGVCYNTQSRTAEEFRLAPDAVCPLCASHMRPAPAL